MHLNAGAGRRERGKTLSKRMLQRLRQEWPRFRCFIGAIGTNGKCAAESTPDGVWQKWLRKSPMHLNAGADRRKRGKALSKRMLHAATAGIAAVQMQPESNASEPGKNRRHTMQFIGHMQDTASLPKIHMVQMLHRRHRYQRQMCRRKRS